MRIALVPAEYHDQVCSTAFCVLRDKNPNTKGRFIYYLVQTQSFIDHLGSVQSGASYPAVTDKIVKEQLVPIPSIEEQIKIADYLQVLDEKIRTHYRRQKTLEDLFRTLLHQLMTAQIRVDKLSGPLIDTD